MIKKLTEAIPELVSRIVIGSVFVESGWAKLHDLAKVSSFFESLGIPFPHIQAPFVAGLEFGAGVLILIGLFTRTASLPLIAIMAVAIRTAKWEDVTDFSSLTGFSEFLYIVILLWLLARGSKYLSVDGYLCRRWNGAACSSEKVR